MIDEDIPLEPKAGVCAVNASDHIAAAIKLCVDKRIEPGSVVVMSLNIGLNELVVIRLVYCLDISDPVGYWKIQ